MSPRDQALCELSQRLAAFPLRRRRIIHEISAHLDAAIDAAMERGLVRDEAEKEALIRLGSVEELASEFARDLAARRMARLSRWLLLAPAMTLLALGVVLGAAIGSGPVRSDDWAWVPPMISLDAGFPRWCVTNVAGSLGMIMSAALAAASGRGVLRVASVIALAIGLVATLMVVALYEPVGGGVRIPDWLPWLYIAGLVSISIVALGALRAPSVRGGLVFVAALAWTVSALQFLVEGLPIPENLRSTLSVLTIWAPTAAAVPLLLLVPVAVYTSRARNRLVAAD